MIFSSATLCAQTGEQQLPGANTSLSPDPALEHPASQQQPLAPVVLSSGPPYFYHGRTYGSEALYTPASLIINGGFDILQSASHSRELSTIKFGTGAKNVWNNLKDPFTQINKYGWGRFIGNEVIPVSLKIDKAQYFPNYTLHLIGGGMESRMLLEWYYAHDVPLPSLFTGLTVAAYHFVNEAVENDKYVGPNVDPIADVYLFDVGGVILFTSDAVCEFFSRTLNLADWSGQPAYNPVYNTIENQGHNFVMKYRLPFVDKTSLFYYFGDSGLLGLSFHRDNHECVSVGGGFVAKALRNVDSTNGARTISVEMGLIGGIFYDRDNSLLASLVISDRINEKAKLNIYPGVFHLGPVSPGLFISLGKGDQLIAGLTVRYAPFGLAYRSSP
ncbi:MAG TPA: hypothetical protein VK470_15740 [Bacteroidota bacterium]|nr:hypothetical protein [Bacteroidota bacterium]